GTASVAIAAEQAVRFPCGGTWAIPYWHDNSRPWSSCWSASLWWCSPCTCDCGCSSAPGRAASTPGTTWPAPRRSNARSVCHQLAAVLAARPPRIVPSGVSALSGADSTRVAAILLLADLTDHRRGAADAAVPADLQADRQRARGGNG